MALQTRATPGFLYLLADVNSESYRNVDEGGKMVGLLTVDDLSWHTDHQLLGDVIEAVYERHG